MSRRADIRAPQLSLPPEKREAVLTEVYRIEAHPLFRSSRRCQTLFRQIVEQTLAGNVDSLKERALGVEVFGRDPNYDTSQDPVVRAAAGEIRKKLAQYYLEPTHESEPRIDLPAGSYYAEFHFAPDKAVEDPHSEPILSALAAKPRRPRMAYTLWTAGALAVVAAVVLVALNWPHSPLDDLWSPILKAPGTVLVCVGLQTAYNPRAAAAQDAIQGIVRQESASPAHTATDGDLVVLRDRYVALDDALCLLRISSLLDRFHRSYRVRAGTSTSFADLRDTAAVLIGAFDNPWTLRTAGQLRFTFVKDSQLDTGMVRDSQYPENSSWKLTNYWPDWDVPVDYAIVTRMVDTTSDRPVIIAAGLTQYGTHGAGELITNRDYFSEAASRLPEGWRRKNLQIVLSVPVVNRTSGRPQILATHVW